MDLIDWGGEFLSCPPVSPVSLLVPSSSPTPIKLLPTLPLLPPPASPATFVLPPLLSDSPSAQPQLTTCAVGVLRAWQSQSASWLEDPSSSPPSPGLRLGPSTLRLHNSFQLPRLHQSLLVHQLRLAPSSLRLRLGRVSPRRHLRTPLLLTAPSHQPSLPPALPQSSAMAFWISAYASVKLSFVIAQEDSGVAAHMNATGTRSPFTANLPEMRDAGGL
ncbi:hypothetical protein Q8A67_021583 [Cirrhinus molitorella]|uniref:Uncharacterized protein n=1 Tax=Cirrhinus molitorella TaxID=172907 RepID=A0AA88PB02_9TELE|nr:hypothetical protein Q8A67_021583 [Cirrhinus molitorella]